MVDDISTPYQLAIEGTAKIDGSRVSDGTVSPRDIDEIHSEGPLRIEIQRPQRDADGTDEEQLEPLQQLLLWVGGACSDQEALDYLALEFAEIPPERWAATVDRADATTESVAHNAEQAARQIEE